DGLPLAEYPVWLVAIDEATAARRSYLEDRFFGEPDGNSRGPVGLQGSRAVLQVVESTTAADGSFVFAGLDPARPYAVAGRDHRLQFLWVTAHADDIGVELAVERQLLCIDARDDAGTVVAGITLRADASKDGRPFVGNAFFAADAAGRCMLLSAFG